MGKARAVVVGLGLAGSEMAGSHVEGYIEHPQVRLVGWIDKSKKQLEKARERWKAGVGSGYIGTGFSVLQRLRPDIISIATSEGTHLQVMRRCLKYWVPQAFFIEKPLATSGEACVEILDLSRKHGFKVAVNHSRAWDRDVIRRKTPKEIRFGGPPWRNDVHAMHLALQFQAMDEIGEISLIEVPERGLWVDGEQLRGFGRPNVMTNAISNILGAILYGLPIMCDGEEAMAAVEVTLAHRKLADERPSEIGAEIPDRNSSDRELFRDDGGETGRGSLPPAIGE